MIIGEVVVNVLDCEIIVSEFELQSGYYIHFRTLDIYLKLIKVFRCKI